MLLVSVRNAVEAASALSGGCQILDIKDPLRGPLGMASFDAMESILRSARASRRNNPVSAALGETQDWIGRNDIPVLPEEISFAKLGPAGLGARLDWRSHWLEVQRRFEQARGAPLSWIAVAYADWRQAQSPAPDSIIEMAIDEGFCGVLVDTFDKTASGLRDWIPIGELSGMIKRVHRAGVLLALAGRVRQEDIPELAATGADIIGIRGAACRGGLRQDEVCGTLVRQFKDSLNQIATSASASTSGPG